MKVLLISLKAQNNIYFFNLGLAYVVAALRQADIYPELALMDAEQMDLEDIKEKLSKSRYDFISFGFLFDNLPRVLKLMAVINDTAPESKVIIGGPGPSACPEYMLRKTGADVAVDGEAELIFPHLLTHYPSDLKSFTTKGIHYRIDDEIYSTGPGEIYEDLDRCPLPAWDAFPMEDYLKTALPPATKEDRYMVMVTSRGCPYRCNFCFHTNKFRFRSPERVAQEVALLQERYRITFIQFYDDLFMSSKERCLSLCDAFAKNNLKFRYRINGRVNIVDDEQLLALKSTGCEAIGYGIESGDQQVLDYMHKKTTIRQIHQAVESTKRHGIHVTTPMIFGQPIENLESLNASKELLMALIDGHESSPRDIRRLTPYPGTDIYKWAVKKGRIKNEEDFFRRFQGAFQFSFNLTNLSDEIFEASLKDANDEIRLVWEKKRQALQSG
jgi:radical SAM superfamily enzyme YgiQ (UPF0313 family)